MGEERRVWVAEPFFSMFDLCHLQAEAFAGWWKLPIARNSLSSCNLTSELESSWISTSGSTDIDCR